MRWVTFDSYGTLVDWHKGFAAIVKPFAGERTSELLRAYHRLEAQLESESPHRSYRDVLTTGLMRAAEEIGLTLSESDARHLPDEWGSQPVFPGVEPMLAALREAGCRLAVLTNCDDDLFDKTHRVFQQPFDMVVTAERVRDYKPSPAHFRYFRRTTGVRAGQWVHVACSWYHDIRLARELGIPSVWLDRDRTGQDRASASAYVQTAAEVPAAVARLLT